MEIKFIHLSQKRTDATNKIIKKLILISCFCMEIKRLIGTCESFSLEKKLKIYNFGFIGCPQKANIFACFI